MDMVLVLGALRCGEDVVKTVEEGVVVPDEPGIAGYEEYEVEGCGGRGV